eukprot:g6584.t2
MDALSLLAYTYEIGAELIDRCESVKQCHYESSRIALRTVRLLGALEAASAEFSGAVDFDASLIELRETLGRARDLVDRCQKPIKVADQLRALARVNMNKEGLRQVEIDLERITGDLQIPMLTDIKRAVEAGKVRDGESGGGGGLDAEALEKAVREGIRKELDAHVAGGTSVGDLINANLAKLVVEESGDEGGPSRDGKAKKAAAIDASSTRTAGQLMYRLGSVRFDLLQEGRILGEGTFGIVLAGTYRGEEVAIKKARGLTGEPGVLKEFRREAEIQFAMRHENIVRVLAFCADDPERPLCLVMERMDESLYDYVGESGISPPPTLRLALVKDVCKGLLFLHLHGIAHRDVKSPNVLLDGQGTAKISDFGLAIVNGSVAKSTGFPTGQKVGSEVWMAPEVHSGSEDATRASDVFSFHVVMWEILTHQRAGTGSPIGQRLLRSPDARLLIGSSSTSSAEESKRVQALLDRCGSVDSKQRPHLKQVLEEVQAISAAADDRAVLVEALLGLAESSERTRSWRSDRDISEWHGIIVNDIGRVSGLEAQDFELGGTIPPELGKLTALKILDLSNNKLSGPIPRKLGALTALLNLDSASNTLAGQRSSIPSPSVDSPLREESRRSSVPPPYNDRVEIIPNEEGNRTTPSYVAFTDTDTFVGDAAKHHAAVNPTNTVFGAMRLVGRQFDDPQVTADSTYWPFSVIEGSDGQPMIEVTIRGEKERFAVEEILSMVLSKMIGIAEAYLGREVKNAVISVPASFGYFQRKAIHTIAAVCGLDEYRLVNGSSVAALGYPDVKSFTDSSEQNVLVVDLGGGTMSVSLLEIGDVIVEVMATYSHAHFGGEDIDIAMLRNLQQELGRKTQREPSLDQRSLRRLRTACERAKRALSSSAQVDVRIDGLWEGMDFHSTMTRTGFEDMNRDFFDQFVRLVETGLKEVKGRWRGDSEGAVQADTVLLLDLLKAPLERAAKKINREYDMACRHSRHAVAPPSAGHAGEPGAKTAVDMLLRAGADETILNNCGAAAVDVVGTMTDKYDPLFEDPRAVDRLLMNAATDRAWRRRDHLVLGLQEERVYIQGGLEIPVKPAHCHYLGAY